ncbi:zinc finger matrin-type protein 5 [Nematolebias whitei]|uniref:zinc finger matrin-type protein 5 n=1 Tax=Nematolebias whitei TaxID=451745 RepID=UPI00189B2300|nr:zinc finger matrin-type protein 5 [Nematolebias whitei]
MGKRYYCDYCDRSFQDNMHNRKKHLNGVQHHRAKKAWFDQFRDATAILLDEQRKKPCKFIQQGICGFGSNCKFSHMSEEEQYKFRRQLEEERWQKEDCEDRMVFGRRVDEWLSKREKRRAALSSKGDLSTKEDTEEAEAEQEIPQQLLSIPDLPPSLLPPPPGGWRVNISSEWG